MTVSSASCLHSRSFTCVDWYTVIPIRGLFVASVGAHLPVPSRWRFSSLPPSFLLSLCATMQLTLFLTYMFNIFCLQLRSDVFVASLFGTLWIQLCSCLQFDG